MYGVTYEDIGEAGHIITCASFYIHNILLFPGLNISVINLLMVEIFLSGGRIQGGGFFQTFDEDFVDDSQLYSGVTVEAQIPDSYRDVHNRTGKRLSKIIFS